MKNGRARSYVSESVVAALGDDDVIGRVHQTAIEHVRAQTSSIRDSLALNMKVQRLERERLQLEARAVSADAEVQDLRRQLDEAQRRLAEGSTTA